MTTVTLFDGPVYYIRAKGHGIDTETCAALSIVLTSLANWAAGHGYPDQKLTPGDAEIRFPASIPGADEIYKLAEIAFQGLAEDKIFLKKVQKLGQDPEKPRL